MLSKSLTFQIVILFLLPFQTIGQILDYKLLENLPGELNHCRVIKQDHKGFIWFGGNNGLVKYNGYDFEIFRNDPKDSTTLNGNNVYSIFEDKEGRMFIGAFPFVLDVYDRETNSFKRYDEVFKGELIGTPTYLYQDNKDKLWIGTNGGLHYVNEKDSLITFNHDSLDINSLSIDYVKFIFEDYNDALWVVTFDGLNLFNKEFQNFENYNTSSHLYKGKINYMVKDSAGLNWMIGEENQLLRIDPDSQELLPDKNSPLINPKVGHQLLVDSQNKIWLSELEKGLFRYDATEAKIDSFELGDYDISALGVDDFENLWIKNEEGISKTFIGQKKFEHIPNWIGNPNNKISVKTLHFDQDENLWIGTFKGLIFWNRKTGERKYYESDPSDLNSLNNNYVLDINHSKDGHIWVTTGTLNGNLHEINPETGEIKRYDLDPVFSKNPMYCVYEDEQGYIWTGTWGSLDRLDRKTGEVRHFLNHTLFYESAAIRQIVPEGDSILWLASRYNGIVRFNKNDYSFKQYTNDKNDPNSLSNIRVHYMYLLEDGKLMLGMENGIDVFDSTTESFDHIDKEDDFLLTNIIGILPGGKGELWLSSEQGLSKFYPEDLTWRNYSREDGVLNGAFSARCVASDKDGNLYFGGVDGINAFSPNQIVDDQRLPEVYLSEFKVMNKSFPLPQSLEVTEDIFLSYKDYFFEFSFAALHLMEPKKNHYSYKLENFNEDWIYSGNERKAVYTNIPPGDYVFRVQACNQDGVWNEEGLSINLHIAPPFWETLWFRFLVLLVIGTGLWLLFRNIQHQRHLKTQKEIAEQSAKFKSQFLANISHEIRTPLNAIIGLNRLMLSTSLDQKQEGFTKAIKESSENLLLLINDLLDHSKIESGKFTLNERGFNIENLIKQVENTLEHKAREKNLFFNFNIDSNIPENLIGDPLRLNQIFINLIGNALKFTQKGGVEVNVNLTKILEEQAQLQFEIIDTGIGIEKGKLESIFESFNQESIETFEIFGGTGLGLTISKQLIEQQGGKINVESTPLKGSKFTVHLSYAIGESQLASSAGPLISGKLKDLKILVVEDTPFNQLLVEELLKSMIENVDIKLAENGLEAIDKIENFDFDLVLMDVKMPVLNGVEATKRIRALKDSQKSAVPIIAVSANALPEHLEEYLSNGMDACVTKPISSEDLWEKINATLNGSANN